MQICSNVKTGYVRTAESCSPAGGVMVSTPGKIILFSPETAQGTIFSPSFSVMPGTMVLIDAYNMPEDYHIYLNRIIKSNYAPTVGDSCDPCAMDRAFGVDGKITFRERMTLGGSSEHWSLLKKNDVSQSRLQLLITIPGMYELELEDTTMLGNMEVEYMIWNNSLTPYLPKDYFAGIKGA